MPNKRLVGQSVLWLSNICVKGHLDLDLWTLMSIGVDYTTWHTFLISLNTSPRVPVINRTSVVCSMSICFLSLSSTTFLSSLRSVGRTCVNRTSFTTDERTYGRAYMLRAIYPNASNNDIKIWYNTNKTRPYHGIDCLTAAFPGC